MKNIKNFNTFVNENLNKVQYNQYVYDYIYDKITEEQFMILTNRYEEF